LWHSPSRISSSMLPPTDDAHPPVLSCALHALPADPPCPAADSFPSDRRTNLQKDRRAPDRIGARAARAEEAVAMTKP
jgi:hypothetical protein